MNDYLVLGGGLAGLSFALEATRKGKSVAVVEKETVVGGLARTIRHEGYRFDLGGHRFHSRDPKLSHWLTWLMSGNLVGVERRSRIHLNGRLVDYPLHFPNALTAFTPWRAARVLTSYASAAIGSNGRTPVSFEDWVVHRFGRELYEVYFQPYTEKVWGLNCADLSAEWASQRIRTPSLAEAIASSLVPQRHGKGPVRRFIYPRLGIGAIAERLAEMATASGLASISLDSPVSGLHWHANDRLWKATVGREGSVQTLAGRSVVSTIPLQDLLNAVDSDHAPSIGAGLSYRDLICVFLGLDQERVSDDTWTYFPDRDLVFGRLHEPRNWSSDMAPDGKTSLCIEIFCNRNEPLWIADESRIIDLAVDDLQRLGMLRAGLVAGAWVERVPNAYPIYRVGYEAELARVNDWVAQKPNLHLLGRTGAFRYLNMDAVMKQGMDLVDTLEANT